MQSLSYPRVDPCWFTRTDITYPRQGMESPIGGNATNCLPYHHMGHEQRGSALYPRFQWSSCTFRAAIGLAKVWMCYLGTQL